jgi:hypothetical protein
MSPSPKRMDFYVDVGAAIQDFHEAHERFVTGEYDTPRTPIEGLARTLEVHFRLDVGSVGSEVWAEYEDGIDISAVTAICDRNGWKWRTAPQI